jgi:hypothetical protein
MYSSIEGRPATVDEASEPLKLILVAQVNQNEG